MKNKKKFKKGDIVVYYNFIKELYLGIGNDGYIEDKRLLGETGIIKEVDKLGKCPYRIKFDIVGYTRPYNKKEIRLATKDEEDKYYLMKYRD